MSPSVQYGLAEPTWSTAKGMSMGGLGEFEPLPVPSQADDKVTRLLVAWHAYPVGERAE